MPNQATDVLNSAALSQLYTFVRCVCLNHFITCPRTFALDMCVRWIWDSQTGLRFPNGVMQDSINKQRFTNMSSPFSKRSKTRFNKQRFTNRSFLNVVMQDSKNLDKALIKKRRHAVHHRVLGLRTLVAKSEEEDIFRVMARGWGLGLG